MSFEKFGFYVRNITESVELEGPMENLEVKL